MLRSEMPDVEYIKSIIWNEDHIGHQTKIICFLNLIFLKEVKKSGGSNPSNFQIDTYTIFASSLTTIIDIQNSALNKLYVAVQGQDRAMVPWGYKRLSLPLSVPHIPVELLLIPVLIKCFPAAIFFLPLAV